MGEQNLRKVDSWIVVEDYAVGAATILKGSRGKNYLGNYQYYVFPTVGDQERVIDLDTLINSPGYFRPHWEAGGEADAAS
jgi:hypothetical protein